MRCRVRCGGGTELAFSVATATAATAVAAAAVAAAAAAADRLEGADQENDQWSVSCCALAPEILEELSYSHGWCCQVHPQPIWLKPD